MLSRSLLTSRLMSLKFRSPQAGRTYSSIRWISSRDFRFWTQPSASEVLATAVVESSLLTSVTGFRAAFRSFKTYVRRHGPPRRPSREMAEPE
jgi:hypothetical protein